MLVDDDAHRTALERHDLGHQTARTIEREAAIGFDALPVHRRVAAGRGRQRQGQAGPSRGVRSSIPWLRCPDAVLDLRAIHSV